MSNPQLHRAGHVVAHTCFFSFWAQSPCASSFFFSFGLSRPVPVRFFSFWAQSPCASSFGGAPRPEVCVSRTRSRPLGPQVKACECPHIIVREYAPYKLCGGDAMGGGGPTDDEWLPSLRCSAPVQCVSLLGWGIARGALDRASPPPRRFPSGYPSLVTVRGAEGNATEGLFLISVVCVCGWGVTGWHRCHSREWTHNTHTTDPVGGGPGGWRDTRCSGRKEDRARERAG